MSSLSPKPELVKHFFETLYPEDPRPGTSIVLWRLADRRSLSLDTTAAAAAAAILDPVNMFVGVGLRHGLLPPFRRGRFDEIAGIPGLFADIDIKSPAHPDEGLPESVPVCMEILGRLPLRPTMIINTGGGIHAYWLFHEFWYFDDAEDRELAKQFLNGWKNVILAEFAAAGSHVDGSTFELTRVLRPAGTVRSKPEVPANLVKTIHLAKRHGWADFEKYRHASDQLPEIIGDLKASRNLNTRMLAMLDNSQDYHEALYYTWMREPKRENQHRWSQSEWDMSLASYLAGLDLPPQDIYDALVAYRARNPQARVRQHEYFARTVSIALARQRRKPEEADTQIQVHMSTPDAAQPFPWTPDDLSILDRALGLKAHGLSVLGIWRASEDRASPLWLDLISQSGEVIVLPIGTIDSLAGEAYAPQTGHVEGSAPGFAEQLAAHGLVSLRVSLTPEMSLLPTACSLICKLATVHVDEYLTEVGVSLLEFQAVVLHYAENHIAIHDTPPKAFKPFKKSDGVTWVFMTDLQETLFPEIPVNVVRRAFKLAFPGTCKKTVMGESFARAAYSLTP